MRHLSCIAFASLLSLACSGASDDPSDTGSDGVTQDDPSGEESAGMGGQGDFPEELLPEELAPDLALIAPEEGDLVVFSDIVPDIEPGADVTYCSFTDVIIDEPFFYNVGLGAQTLGGHHAVLQYTTTPVEPGTRPCSQEEMDGQILIGGTAGKNVGSAVDVPPEIAVEIPAGAQFVINHHYINTTAEPIDGQAMMVAKAHSADEMVLAGQMIMGSMGWQLPAQAQTAESTEVVFEDDMAFFMTGGHMHEWGTQVTVEVEPADGGEADAVVDTVWTPELATGGEQDFSMFPLDEPYVIHAGDTVRLTCEWDNDTDEPIEFPREMCIFVGYTVDAKNRYAFNGMWINPETIDPDTFDSSQLGL